MTSSRGDATSATTVERFKPTNGILTGWVGLMVVAVGIGYVVLEGRTTTGLRVALGLACFGVVVWVTQLRSRAAAYPQTLLMKNSLVDTSIPLRLVDEVTVGRTLNVWVGDRRYVCIGIGRSLSSLLKDRPTLDKSAMAYETFVVSRIQALAEQARRSPPSASPDEVRRRVAWPEIMALTVSGTAFLAALLL